VDHLTRSRKKGLLLRVNDEAWAGERFPGRAYRVIFRKWLNQVDRSEGPTLITRPVCVEVAILGFS
jgi:hypothetical protein